MHIARTHHLPNTVKRIKWMAFQGCQGLMAVTLGEGLEEIEEEAFRVCTSLERFIIPNTVKTIILSKDAGCSGLTTVTLGSGLEEIGVRAY